MADHIRHKKPGPRKPKPGPKRTGHKRPVPIKKQGGK